jgi:hypothetical protein
VFTIKIAGVNVAIDNRYEGVRRLCRDYLTDETSDFTVSVGESEIEDEVAASVTPVTSAYAESICIYRKICRKMPDNDAFLLHSAVVGYEGRAYAFSAPSGTGKSTHARIWTERFTGARIINGDKPIIRFTDGKAYIYGTPWCGKEGQNVNISLPLAAICFIERGEQNVIRPAECHEVTARLLSQILIPREPGEIAKLMPLIDGCVRAVPCFILKCNISKEAAEVAYEAMKNR